MQKQAGLPQTSHAACEDFIRSDHHLHPRCLIQLQTRCMVLFSPEGNVLDVAHRAEKQVRAQNKAADDLFTAKLKAGKAKAGTKR
jgi:hypothetical protein